MADGAGINEDNGVVLRLLNEADDLIEHELLGLRVVLWGLRIQGRLETGGRDAFVREIGGESEVRGVGLKKRTRLSFLNAQ